MNISVGDIYKIKNDDSSTYYDSNLHRHVSYKYMTIKWAGIDKQKNSFVVIFSADCQNWSKKFYISIFSFEIYDLIFSKDMILNPRKRLSSIE